MALLVTLNGQWCRALGRLVLPASRAEEYLAAIETALAEVTVGDPFDLATTMGPIVHSEHLAQLTATIDAARSAGATVIAPTALPDAPGNWLAPTLLVGLQPAEATCEEMFGPVAAVHTCADVDGAVAIANGTGHGLEAYVLGADTDAALAVARRIRAGEVKVNGVSPMNLHPMAPRPAFGLSGMHDEGTVETIEFFGGHRVVGVEGSI